MTSGKVALLVPVLAAMVVVSPARAGAQAVPAGVTRVTCASDGGGRHQCLVDTHGGVRLVRQLSSSACTEGRTWGIEARGIWVDRGCRAEFEVSRAVTPSSGGWNGVPPLGGGNAGGNGGWGSNVSPEITCASDNNGYKECPVSGTWREGRLVRQTSTAACTEGTSWGWRNNRIWVNKGCRGTFQARNAAMGGVQRVSCASSGGMTRCPANVRGGVRLVRQISSASCVQGRSWGTQPGSIWVTQGCRAEFETGRVRPIKPVRPTRPTDDYYGNGSGADIVTCGSSGNSARSSCPTGGRAVAVRVQRERSSGRCVEGSGWGWTPGEIWTSRGCVADFQVRRQ